MKGFNHHGVWAIYRFEMARALRTLWQSLVTPVITTALYFVVFGGAIGSRMQELDGVSYGSFIVPGLIMMNLLQLSISNASIGIYFPKFTGTIYELLSAPVSTLRGGDQVDRDRPDHPVHRDGIRRCADRASVHDADDAGADRSHLFDAGLHHRDLGQGV